MKHTLTLFLISVSAFAAVRSIPAGLANRPLAFEPNRGQAAPPVRFLARGNSRDYLLSASGVTVQGATLHFSGANAEPNAFGVDPLAERHNYFHGSVSQTDIPTFQRVRYSGLYKDIDCLFYGDQKGLEFDFEVAAGADPNKIRLRWSEAKSVRLDANGELVIETAAGELRLRKPTVYQERDGRRTLVAGGYRMAVNGEIRFSLGRYDRTLPLVIDPVIFALDQNLITVNAMAGDGAGNLYLTGQTGSSVLPTTVGAVQPAYGGGTCVATSIGPGGSSDFPCPDAFVIKLDATGQIAYATYLGGNGYDGGAVIAADSSGNAYVGGFTFAGTTPNNFPTTPNAPFPKPSTNPNGDGFLTKLNPAGSQLVYSTYVPALPISGIAADGQGNTYFVGSVNPGVSFTVTAGAFQTTRSSTNGAMTGVVGKLNSAGSALVYATYLGGSGAQEMGDRAMAIAVDASGDAYVAGFAGSTNFPTAPGAYLTTLPALGGIYVTEIAPTGASLIYSTFLGPEDASDNGIVSPGAQNMTIRVDSQGNAIVLAATVSPEFPVTAGAFQSTGPSAAWASPAGAGQTALAKLNPTGSALVYSTYITGGGSLDIDSAGNAYVAGTASYGFPTTAGAYQACSHGGSSDVFATEFAPNGTLLGATYLGGSGADAATSVVAASAGSVDIAGTTNSPDFPTIVENPIPNLAFVASILINNPNQTDGPCLAYSIQNAASFNEGAIAPGEVVTLRGTGIGPQTGVSAKSGPSGFPTNLGGVQVFFNNQPAPLLYVQSEQINAVVPWGAGNDSFNPAVSVEVKYNGASVSGDVLLNQTAPGIFLANYTTQLGAITNANGTPNSTSNPAPLGSVITFYGTGGGPLNPPGGDGEVWPTSPLSNLTLPLTVQVNGVNANVTYSGSAPGSVSGVFQINVQVPNLFSPPPTVPMTITIGGVASPPVFLVVQQ
jgi:uncharacterized protein (TIGR03437 family)